VVVVLIANITLRGDIGFGFQSARKIFKVHGKFENFSVCFENFSVRFEPDLESHLSAG